MGQLRRRLSDRLNAAHRPRRSFPAQPSSPEHRCCDFRRQSSASVPPCSRARQCKRQYRVRLCARDMTARRERTFVLGSRVVGRALGTQLGHQDRQNQALTASCRRSASPGGPAQRQCKGSVSALHTMEVRWGRELIGLQRGVHMPWSHPSAAPARSRKPPSVRSEAVQRAAWAARWAVGVY